MNRRTPLYDCDCDTVLAMEEMAVGVEEILQYARAVLPRREVSSLLRGLESILGRTGRAAAGPDARRILVEAETACQEVIS